MRNRFAKPQSSHRVARPDKLEPLGGEKVLAHRLQMTQRFFRSRYALQHTQVEHRKEGTKRVGVIDVTPEGHERADIPEIRLSYPNPYVFRVEMLEHAMRLEVAAR